MGRAGTRPNPSAPRRGPAPGVLRRSWLALAMALASAVGGAGLQTVSANGTVATAEPSSAPASAENAASDPGPDARSGHAEADRPVPGPPAAIPGTTPPGGVSDPSSLVNDPSTDGESDTQAGTSVALSGGNVVAAFSDSGSLAHGEHRTGYSVSTNGGVSFTDRGELPASRAGDGSNAQLASDTTTGRVYMATMSYTGLDQLQLFRSDDGGVTFGPPVNPTPNFAGRGDLLDRLWLTVDNFPGPGQGTVYLVWRHYGGPLGGALYLNRSTDGGTTWAATDISAFQVYSGQGPFVTIAPDHSVLVAYHESPYSYGLGQKVQFRRSTDQGRTWEPKVTVADLRAYGGNGNLELWGGFRTNAFPQMAANPVNGDVYLVYNDLSEVSTDWANVYLTVSHDHGVTWSPPERVDTDTGLSDQFMPSIAVSPDGTNVVVGFYDRRVDDWLIRHMAVIGDVSGSTVTFGRDFALGVSYPPVVAQDPLVGRTFMGSSDQIVADGQFFYLTWTDNRDPHLGHRNQPDVRFAKIPKDLNSLTSELTVSVAAGPDPVPVVAATEATILVTNGGPDDAPYVEATAQLPADFAILSIAASQGACALTESNKVSCALGTVARGASATVLVRSEAGVAPGPATFTAVAGSVGRDTQPSGDTSTAAIQVVARPNTVTTTYSSGAMSGSVRGPETAEFALTVPDNAGIVDVDVRLHISHTDFFDVNVTLVAPDGTEVRVVDQRGIVERSTDPPDCTGPFTELDDQAPVPIWSAPSPYAGVFRPAARLSGLRGGPTGGQWRLRVEDPSSPFSTVVVSCWELDILNDTANVPPPPPPPPPPTTTTTTTSTTSTTSTTTTTTTTVPLAAQRAPQAPPTFASSDLNLLGSHPESVVSADFTGDGRDDVAVTASFSFDAANDHGVFLFTQTAAGGLSAPVRMSTHATHNLDEMGAAAADVDGDGQSDLLVASDHGIDVFLQRDGGLLPARLEELYGPQQVVAADIDQDGRLDVIVETLTNVVTLIGRGDGTFEPAREILERRYRGIHTGDVTGDGLTDIVGRVDGGFSVVAGRTGGEWAPPVPYPPGPGDYFPGGISVGDFTGDGRSDVAWAVEGSTAPQVRVFAQTPAGTLAPPVRYAGKGGGLVAADMNGDGRTDLVQNVSVLVQQADGSLATQRDFDSPSPQAVTTGDVNGDGLPDILVAYLSGLSVLRSTTDLRTWGLGNYGQLGTGPGGVGAVPAVAPSPAPVLTDVASVVAGGFHNVAANRDGTVRTWGLNHVGQLGIGSTANRSTPTVVAGLSHVTTVAAGYQHSLAVTEDGSVWTWGWNKYGQLGDGTTTDRLVPVKVAGLHDVVAVAAGVTHSLAVTRTGEVWAWGLNHVGQLGTGTNVGTLVPVRLAAPTGVVAVAAGYFHSLALTADGRVWSWGYNNFGQLGSGSAALWDLVPKMIPPLLNIAAIAAGAYHSVALQRWGMVETWGFNNVGQLGIANTYSTGIPTAVRGRGNDNAYFLDGVVAIAAGGYHTLAIGRDGRMTAWGWNYFGQLGTGTTVDRNVPTPVPAIEPGLFAAGLAHSLAVTARGG
ncbi:MAG: hypothetical protein QOG43_1451 [Actinomycetota bacterium]|nr:hypothetical protein [Actinomycetota bacterium]